MTRRFSLAFDYLCPFARNASEHVAAGLRHGADWDVTFVPYSLAQGHVEDGEPAVWDRAEPNRGSGILALQVGLTVRDELPHAFLDVHEALFAARHDHGLDLRDADVLRRAVAEAGADADKVFELLGDGRALDTLRREHVAAVADHQVWGVPTFVTDRRAAFVRLLDRPEGDGERAVRVVERVLDLLDETPVLHEFKQTDLPR